MIYKLVTIGDFEPIRNRLRAEGKKLVFTNGCFDIIHRGHIDYLTAAKALGDILIIGLNSDRSVREIKGFGRPIVELDDRAAVLSALECVDYIIIFDEPTPAKLIEALLPDILVKGADWSESEIVGAETVKRAGGEVVRIPLTSGKSTSAIIEKIIELYGGK
ncbi:D-glycero-beta-D-manno-heptose 1-phosphate adenylyltransferase [bacterium]|nr:MAG: D-glycero-beta-D-manno-heptose 1-phosphate adenylyltransferase [bacterium]